MFQNLRQNHQFYVLYKSKSERLKMDIGTVVDTKGPYPTFIQNPTYPGQMQMVVDVVVSINGQNSNFFKLPADKEIADFGHESGIVVSSSREAMSNEVKSICQQSEVALASRDYHQAIVDSSKEILDSLMSPEDTERKKQREEIDSLKGQLSDMTRNMQELVALNRSLMEKLQVSETPKTNKQ